MPRRVVIVALPEVQPLDVTGPAEVLASAASVAGGDDAAYTIEVVAPGGAPIPTDSGYAIAPAGALEAVHGPIDTLLVAGGAGARNASPETVARVRRLAARADRVASVCTGATSSPPQASSTAGARRPTGAGATTCSAAIRPSP